MEQGIIASADIKAIVVLDVDGPLGVVNRGDEGLGPDEVVLLERVCNSSNKGVGFLSSLSKISLRGGRVIADGNVKTVIRVVRHGEKGSQNGRCKKGFKEILDEQC